MSSGEAAITDEKFRARFEAARQECFYGHKAGCTYGGMSPVGGYWLAVEGCLLPHGESCATCGRDAEARFGDWASEDGELLIWGVPLCGDCKERELALHPEKWRAPSA